MKKLLFAAAAAAIIGAAAAAPYLLAGDGLIYGMTVDGAAAGGMTAEELGAFIDGKNEKIGARAVTLRHGTVEKVWKYADFSVRMDTEKETERLMAIGRSGDFVADFLTRWKVLTGGLAEHLTISYDNEKTVMQIAALSQEYSQEPEVSRPEISADGAVSFAHVKPYMKIDETALASLVDARFRSGAEGVIEIPVLAEKKAALTAEQQKEIDRVLGVYTTYFGNSANRSENIRHAAESIDGSYIPVGQSFSYNGTTGLRTRENGYLDAPVFFDGKLVPDAGGGVCQVSTTLFNAVLLAGLAVTDRTCHFAPVAYAPIGRDATVADNYLDFGFMNNLSHPVYICAVYEPGAITTYILGNHADETVSVSIEETENKKLPHKTVERVDPSQQENKKVEEGNDGYDVTVATHAVFADGRTHSDTFRSFYEPVDTVVTYKSQKLLDEAKKPAKPKETKKAGKTAGKINN